MKIGSKSLLFLGFIFAIFGIEYARRKYLETKNENEGFSKATEDAKFYGQITLFIVLYHHLLLWRYELHTFNSFGVTLYQEGSTILSYQFIFFSKFIIII